MHLSAHAVEQTSTVELVEGVGGEGGELAAATHSPKRSVYPEPHVLQSPLIYKQSAHPVLMPFSVQQLPPLHELLAHSLSAVQDPEVISGTHSSMVSLNPELHVVHEPAEDEQSSHPAVMPFVVQQLPPLHEPVVHSLPAVQDPV